MLTKFKLNQGIIKKCLIVLAIGCIFSAGYKAKAVGIFPIKKWFVDEKREIKTSEKQFIGNDFLLTLKPYIKDLAVEKSAGIIEENDNQLKVFEQADALKIWHQYHLDEAILDATPTLEYKGGLKRIFSHNNQVIGLFAMKSNTSSCYFGSLINLTTKKEIFRASCIPSTDFLDFNALGGGHVSLDDNLLVALGTPTTDDDQISYLAQDKKSPYGKILIFSNRSLSDRHIKDISQFSIYSSGHRNPQGIVRSGQFIYAVEHGPKGGDEINLIEQGKNYGWPLYSLGSKYAGPAYHGVSSTNNYISPVFAFIPSIGISNITNCPPALSKRYAPLTCLIVSSLRAESIFIVLVDPKTQHVLSSEQIKTGMRNREFFQIKSQRIFMATDVSLYELVFDPVEKFTTTITNTAIQNK